jgi:hypothetical protein
MKNKDKQMIKAHVKFLESYYLKPLNDISLNLGWVSTDDSITSKIYETGEFVETFYSKGEWMSEVTA